MFEAASVEAPDGVGGADVLRVLIAATVETVLYLEIWEILGKFGQKPTL